MSKTPERTIFIGDVHGCLEELKLLLAKINYVAGHRELDRLIFVGDLVDRGPDSAGVVNYVRVLGAECVIGNHDNKYIRFNRHENKKLASLKRGERSPYKNPMRLGDSKLSVFHSMGEENLEWLSNLPSSIHIPDLNVLVVHAGVKPGTNPFHQADGTLFHCRFVDADTHKLVKLGPDHVQPEGSKYWAEFYNHTVDIVHGHHVHERDAPTIYTNDCGARCIDIDTGACFGGNLTAMIYDDKHPEGYFESVKALKVYYDR